MKLSFGWLILFFLAKSVASYAQPSNNNFVSAISIGLNSCSADAAFTTVAATSDLGPGSCWNTTGGSNVWFKFVATTTQVSAQIFTGGTEGTLRFPYIAIWQSDGTTQVKCKRYTATFDDVEVSTTSLTIGNTYYISVDNDNGSAAYRGTFKICLADVASFDYYEGAIDVTPLINSCSSDAVYTTIGGSSDKNKGTCWNTNGGVALLNKWFKFTAPASGYINVTVDRGGSKGTQQRSQVAIWQSDGITQVSCNRYVNDGDDVVAGSASLTPGATYYISVDVQDIAYAGTFTLCLSDALDYDYYEGAIDVTSLINSCSTDAAYTTIGGTRDKNPASCWNTNGGVALFNRWFKFTAPASGYINITVDRGGSKGTQQRTQVAIWQSDGTTQVACNRYVNDGDDVVVGSTSLTPGATYYISVDAQNTGYYGSFTLCLSDALDYDYYEGAIDVTSLINSCSPDALYTTIGGTRDKNPASCWNTNGGVALFNRWFKFTAPASGYINITVDRGGSKGTQQRTQVAIWQSDGTTQVACNRYVNDGDDVVVGSTSLTPGATYYISVDAQNAGYYGSFTLCLSDALDYDYYEGAILISDINNWCSSDALYTTIGGTRDKNPASCWNTNGGVALYNRWFKFVASSTGLINVTVDRGGSKGTQQRTQVAIWQSDGITQVSCNRYVNDGDVVVVGSTSLTPGATYYISVDAQNAGYYGSFTLCVTDVVDYDYYEGAIEITNLNNWCSGDAVYTTIGGTTDKNRGSCWNTGATALYNRWFKFTAVTPNATIIVDRGGTKGTQQRTQVALWQANGTTQVACNRYTSDTDDVSISTSALVPGSVYYISVDAQSSGYRGTFSLCVNNIGTTYYSRQSGAWNDVNTWSTIGYGGAIATSFPNGGDVANIRNHDVSVTTTGQQVAEINMDVTTSNTSLTVNTGLSFIVNGKATLTNAGNNFNCTWLQQNNSSTTILDNLNLTRSGGNQSFGVTLNTGSSLIINRDLNWTSSAGTVNLNLLTMNGNSAMTVNRDINLTSTGGQQIQLLLNSTSVLTVARDIVFTASAAGLENITLNNSSRLRIGRNFVRGGTPFGSLVCNNTSTVEYSGNTYLQTFAPSAGSGGDSFSYFNVVINNTRSTTPQITMGGAATVNGNLTLTSGVVSSTAANILNLTNTTSTTIGSTSSYIDGPMTYVVATNTANTIRNFPIGKSGSYRPAILTVTHTNNNPVTYTAEHFSSSAGALGYTLPPTVERVSGVRYWQITSSDQTNLSSARVRLYYGIGTSDGVTDPANLTVVKNVGIGTTWFDVGGTASGAGSGNILSGSFNSFSIITLGNLNGGTNPLPVQLSKFSGRFIENDVELYWTTASELNNSYFSVLRSADGVNFETLTYVEGAGTKLTESRYSWIDNRPLSGINYYQLKQTDFDGKFSYSKVIAVRAEISKEKTFVVFPNPAFQHETEPSVYLSGMVENNEYTVDIYSTQGKVIRTIILLTDDRGEAMVPIKDHLLPGLYVLKLQGYGNDQIRLVVY